MLSIAIKSWFKAAILTYRTVSVHHSIRICVKIRKVKAIVMFIASTPLFAPSGGGYVWALSFESQYLRNSVHKDTRTRYRALQPKINVLFYFF